MTSATPALFGSPRSELQDLPCGPAIQRCRRILVKINGGEETTMDLHHSLSPSLWSPRLLFSTKTLCVHLLTLAGSHCPYSCFLSILFASTSGHLSGGGEVIYSSLQENASSSVFTERPHCSGYENGLFAQVVRGYIYLQASRQITDDMYLFDTVPRNRQTL